LSRRPRPPLRLLALALLGVALLFAPGAAPATATGTVVTWGCGSLSDVGQCSVPGLAMSGVAAIAAGTFHNLALKQDGTLVAWGCGGSEDLGQCTVPTAASSGVTAIAASGWDSLALRQDGSVVAWGCGRDTNFGQCTVPPAASSGVTAIAAGLVHSLALKQDGSVIAWGCGLDYGQCTIPAAATSGVTAIAAGYSHSLALKQDGSVIAWGCGGAANFGQCTVPPAAGSGVTAIAAGFRHSLALKQDGSVLAWGCGDVDYGQCTVPPAASTGVTAISAGESHSLALKQDGNVVAWGCGSYGGINRDFGQCTVPRVLCGVTAISAGVFHSLALFARGCQEITFGVLGNKTYRDPDFAVSASATSGLPISFSATGNCTVTGKTVHLTAAGSCTVTASQPGNENYNPAPDVPRTFAIAKAAQAISFGPLAKKTYGAPDFSVHATASSDLPISFAGTGKCAVTASRVHLRGVGSCTITASQPGNANYKPAANVSRTFSIAPPPCRVPKVVGKRLASARLKIAKSHCRTGKVRHAYSRNRKKGIVISQSRRPGRVLPAQSKVNLVVSRGRRR
jgi:Regulator of chromosome condensation (RCC1) repeat/PASTA domain